MIRKIRRFCATTLLIFAEPVTYIMRTHMHVCVYTYIKPFCSVATEAVSPYSKKQGTLGRLMSCGVICVVRVYFIIERVVLGCLRGSGAMHREPEKCRQHDIRGRLVTHCK